MTSPNHFLPNKNSYRNPSHPHSKSPADAYKIFSLSFQHLNFLHPASRTKLILFSFFDLFKKIYIPCPYWFTENINNCCYLPAYKDGSSIKNCFVHNSLMRGEMDPALYTRFSRIFTKGEVDQFIKIISLCADDCNLTISGVTEILFWWSTIGPTLVQH